MKKVQSDDKIIYKLNLDKLDEKPKAGSFKNKLVELAVPGWMKRSYEGSAKYMGRNGYLRTGLFLGYMSLQVMTHYWLNQNFFKARSRLDDVLNAPKVDANEFDKSFMSVFNWVAVWIGFEVIGNLFQAVFRYSLQSAIKTDLNKRLMETGAFNGIKYSLANESIDETTVINVDVNTYVSNVSYLTSAFTMATAAFTLGLKNLKVLLSLPVIVMGVGVIIFMKLLTWTVSGIIRSFNNDITQLSRKAMLINSTVKKSSESIAFVGGEKFELKQLLNYTKQGLEKSIKMAFMGTFLSFVSSWKGFGLFAFGLYLSRDKLINKQMNFSDAMMIGEALGSVINYLTRADEQNEWILEYEVAYNRIKELESEIKKWELAKKEMAENLKITQSKDKNIRFKGIINKPNGEEIFNNKDKEIVLESGKIYKLGGPSGVGKSTFLKTLAGFWPYVKDAELTMPKKVVFIPQSTYIPGIGTSLIDVIKYPRVEKLTTDERNRVEKFMKAFGLEKKIEELDLTAINNVPVQYGNTLSGGEMKRIALIRALLDLETPDFLVLDEVTTGVDALTKKAMYQALKQEMKDGVILFIEHKDEQAKDSEISINENISEKKKPEITIEEVQNFGA